MESADTSSLTGVVSDVHNQYCEDNKGFYSNIAYEQSCFKSCNDKINETICSETLPNQCKFKSNMNIISDSKVITSKKMNSVDMDHINETRKPHFLDEDYVPPIDSSHKLHLSDIHNILKSVNSSGVDASIDKSLNSDTLESFNNSELLSDDNKTPAYFSTSSIDSLEIEPVPGISSVHHSTWPVERGYSCWGVSNHSQSFEHQKEFQNHPSNKSLPLQLNSAVLTPEMFGSKVKCVYSLLSMLDSHNSIEMSREFLEMSKNLDSCVAMRQSGCIPLLVQLVHSDPDPNTKQKAALALYNVIRANPDDKSGRREAKVLKLLQQIRDFCDLLRFQLSEKEVNKMDPNTQDEQDIHPTSVIGVLTKISFDEEHRHAMCDLGALHAIADMMALDHAAHGNTTQNPNCITIRRYAGMALTNLTFGDGKNKSLLCSFKDFLKALVTQLYSSSDELMQASASVLRNMSWRADSSSKQILRDAGAVLGLTHAAMKGKKETTLKSILSALWNLSAHCSLNKVDICSVDGALGFLVEMLKYKAPSKTLAIVENAGGILRNISSHIALREDYREILRQHNCLTILLQQLKSPSLIIVSNACGTLWNLSARNSIDQQFLWENGAVPLLRSLIYSKHKMISMGSSAALKNLLNAKPDCVNFLNADSPTKDLGLPTLPTLGVRKQKSLHEVLDQSLSETCENIEPVSSSSNGYSNIASQIPSTNSNSLENRKIFNNNFKDRNFLSHSCSNSLLQKGSKLKALDRSESKDSITSAHSDSVYERALRRYLVTIPDYQNESGYNNSITKLNSISLNDDCHIYSNKKDGFMSFNEYTKKLEQESKIKYFNAPLRSNYTENDCMEVVQDQPIDYSRKYSEQKIENNTEQIASSTTMNIEDDAATYGDYQETDLDQPTDYSLRYGEHTSDSISDSEKQSSTKVYYEEQEPNFVHEDTIKCYYTEGTPYETTPYNFSTTTSLSDIRMTQQEYDIKEKDKHEEKEICDKVRDEMIASDEKDTCSDYNDAAVEQNNAAKSEEYSKFSSGIGSPEKPVNYCEEGTPGYFSRVSSLSSLDGFNEPKIKYADNTATGTEKSPDNNKDSNKNNAKVVSFVQGPDYAQETPLMFSRSSSLGSLSSIEQPDVQDDHNSVVSDFSRLTSGIVSPSELPDSPTQTVPTTAVTQSSNNQKTMSIDASKDQVATYAEEGTPAHFSCVTSLSALTIEDECSGPYDNDDVYKNKSSNNSTGVELQLVSEGDEEDDDILAACINIGMQKRRTDVPMHSTPKYNPKVNNDTVRHYCTEDTPAVMSKAASNSDLLSLNELQSFESADEITVTKTMIKPIPDADDILSDSSNSSTENKDLLGECIQFGMMKPNPSTNLQGRQATSSIPVPSEIETAQTHISPNYLVAKDEVALYEIEDTPYNFSVCSSISDLTINSVDKAKPVTRLICGSGEVLDESKNDISHENSPQKLFSFSSPTSAGASHEDVLLDVNQSSYARKPRHSGDVAGSECASSMQNHSFSSSSVESFDSPDGEFNLFEQCIKSGLPKQKSPSSNVKRVAARSLNDTFNQNKTADSPTKMDKTKSCKKTVSQIPTFKSSRKSCNETKNSCMKTEESNDLALLEECIYSGMPKRKPEVVKHKIHKNDIRDESEDGKTKYTVNDKVLNEENKYFHEKSDENAMVDSNEKIEVMNELTTENSDVTDSKVSVKTAGPNSGSNNSTEDTYSYDMSFPSISCTVPNVVNLDQESDDISLCISTTLDESDINIGQEKSELNSLTCTNNRFESFKQNFDKAMSNSSIIEYEASKLASALENADNMVLSNYSMSLDQIKPPSPMGSMLSLSQSACSNFDLDLEHNTNLNKTRNPLPGSLLVRRALNSYFNTASDNLEQSLNNASTYNLDSIKAPSVMNDLDMDNSINSVASITSEIADCKFGNSTPLSQTMMNSMQYNFSEIEDINPPSILSDITVNDTIISSIEKFTSLENSETNDKCIVSRKSLTPKQNRQLSKERYLTYTLQQDIIQAKENTSDKPENSDNNSTGSNQSSGNLSMSPRKLKLRKTCKQRRQEDRARFQTQVLDISTDTPESKASEIDTNTFIKKSLKQKRWDDRDRFKTRNLKDKLCDVDNDADTTRIIEGSEFDLENMLAHDADLVLGRLSDNTHNSLDSNVETVTLNDNECDTVTKPSESTFIINDKQELEMTITLNKTIDGGIPTEQSQSYVINHIEGSEVNNELETSVEEYVHSGPEIVKPTTDAQKPNNDNSKVVRPRHKASYVSPYRNTSSRQLSRNSISKPKIISNKQVDSKTVLNSMLTMKPSLSRFTKVLQHKSDNVMRKNSPALGNKTLSANKITTNIVTTKQPQMKPLERQGTFTKEEANQIINLNVEMSEVKKLPSPKKRISAIPCKLPKSVDVKSLATSNLRKPSPKSNVQKQLIVENSNKARSSVIPMKTGIPSKSIPTSIKLPSNITGTNLKIWQQPSSKLSNVYKKSEEARRVSDNNYKTKAETDSMTNFDRKRIQRSQTFDNRASDKCILAHATKQKSSIGIRAPQRYNRI